MHPLLFRCEQHSAQEDFETAGQFLDAFSKEVLSSNVYSLNYDEDGLGYFHDASIGLLSDVLVEVSQYHQLAGMAIYLFDRLFIFLNWDFQEPFVAYKVDNEEEFVALEATTNAALNVVCWPEQTILSACFGIGHGNEHLQATTLVLVHFWLTYRNERQTRESSVVFGKLSARVSMRCIGLRRSWLLRLVWIKGNYGHEVNYFFYGYVLGLGYKDGTTTVTPTAAEFRVRNYRSLGGADVQKRAS